MPEYIGQSMCKFIEWNYRCGLPILLPIVFRLFVFIFSSVFLCLASFPGKFFALSTQMYPP